MNMPLLTEHISKAYGKKKVLTDVSFSMRQGEIFALLGPNGAGKTTLIKILATLLTRDGGKISVYGCDPDQDSETVRHLIGYVGQDTERSAYARLTVAENLLFFGRLRGMSRGQIRQQMEKLADYFNFHSNLNSLFVHLSGGQKQTVVIMRALLHDPPLVFLDEPTKGLDPVIGRKIRGFLRQYIKGEKKALLLTSHMLTEVDELSDRVALINRGTLPVIGPPGRLKSAAGAEDFIEFDKELLPGNIREMILGQEPVLFDTESAQGKISFGISDFVSGMEAVAGVLRRNGLKIPFSHHSVTLEDAYLRYAGELAERFE